MYVSSSTLAPFALRRSEATLRATPAGCELRVPFSGTLTPQRHKALTSALRRLVIQMRYGTRLKGLTVSVEGSVLSISAAASAYAVRKWIDSGDLLGAVESAVASSGR